MSAPADPGYVVVPVEPCFPYHPSTKAVCLLDDTTPLFDGCQGCLGGGLRATGKALPVEHYPAWGEWWREVRP